MSCSGCGTSVTESSDNPARSPDRRFSQQVVSSENAFLLDSMMREVIRSGTGQAAQRLNRDDAAGKTGTTNNYFDAWFTGYSTDIVATVWVGFDRPQDLGQGESGARAALPIWIDFMEAALSGKAHPRTRVPENIIRLRVNRQTGLPTNEEDPDSYLEFFIAGTQPTTPHAQSAEDLIENLF